MDGGAAGGIERDTGRCVVRRKGRPGGGRCRISKLVIVGMFLLLAGCATGGGDTAVVPSVDVTGTWNGSFVGSGFNFPFVAVLEHKGNIVTGTISGATRTGYNGPIQGAVSGNKFSWKQPIGTGTGDLVVSEHEMRGTGMAPGTYSPGTVTLRRAQ